MAEGDEFILCSNNQASNEQIWRLLVREDANGNACLNVCGDTSGVAGGKTPISLEETNTTGSIPIGSTEISVLNNGANNGVINGVIIRPGQEKTWGFKDPIDTAIAWDSTGAGTTTLSIDYMD